MTKRTNDSIFKYSSANNIDHIFSSSDTATLKFSLPADFNDPFELFLTLDFNRDPDELAFYLDIIGGKLLQLPTTCFSVSPVVTPMWAHYAQNSQGFVIEFSEGKLADAFPDALFRNVNYSDVPTVDLSGLLVRAHRIMKFRYNKWLTDAIFSSAYFTKTDCWSYEQERRMVIDDKFVRSAGSLLLMDVPRDTIRSIICGPKASTDTADKLKEIAADIGCQYYELRMGRSSATPFFVDTSGNPFAFCEAGIVRSAYYCRECREPTGERVETCSWCMIDDDARQRAAQSNSFRLLDRLGLLESYIKNSP